MRVRVPSAAVVAAASALGVPSEALRPLAGASGRTWDAGEHVMRLGDAVALDVEAMACAAAASVVATPEVLDRVDLDSVSAVLVRRLPGTPAGRLEGIGRRRARHRGAACGRLHAMFAEIIAPAGVPPVSPRHQDDSLLDGGRLVCADRRVERLRRAGRSVLTRGGVGVSIHARRPGEPLPPAAAGRGA